MKVWITRAEPGAGETADRLARRGFDPIIAPLLAVRDLAADVDLAGIDALAFTSRNAVAAFAGLSPDRTRPVFAVGDATAQAAHDVGFQKVRSADGDLVALAALVRAEATGRAILNPRAAEPAGDLAALVGDAGDVRGLPVYETIETAVGPPQDWDAVLIHSPRAARALAALAPDGAGRIAVAISGAASKPLSSLPLAEVRVAVRPNEAALLDALGNPGSGV